MMGGFDSEVMMDCARGRLLIAMLSTMGFGCAAPAGGGPGDDDDGSPEAPPEPVELAARIDGERLAAWIQQLQDLGTRHTGSGGDEAARDLLAAGLMDLGLPAEIDGFDAGGVAAANLIARNEGAEAGGPVWIYSAHYDSTSEQPLVAAPGADDNASGVAAGLEAARVLAEVELRDPVWFVFTAAEEQGALGAEHLAARLDDEGVEVGGVLAPDMIGYWPGGDSDAVDLLGDEDSEWLVAELAALADALGIAHQDWIAHDFCWGDDHTIYQDAGFPAISPMDCVEAHNLPETGETTPHYHRSSDTVETLHMGQTARVAGLMTAGLAELAGVRGWTGE